MVSLSRAVGELVTPQLMHYGFAPVRKRQSNTWTFERTVEGRIQTIHLLKSNHLADSLKIQVATDSYPSGSNLHRLSLGAYGPWWTYHDEESRKAALEDLVQLTISLGLPWFDSQK